MSVSSVSIEDRERIRQLSKDEDAFEQLLTLFDKYKQFDPTYRFLFEQSNDAVFILDLTGIHIRTNRRACDMLGYAEGEIDGLSYRDVVVDVQHNESSEILEKMLAGEKILPYERTFRHKDGRLVPTEVNVELVRDHEGNPVHIQSIVRDITERKQAEDALRASEQTLQNLIEQIPVGIQIFDTDGLCTKVNQAHLDIFGVKRSDLEQRYNIFDDPFAEINQTDIAAQRALNGELVQLGEIEFDFTHADPRYASPDQQRRTVNVTIMPIIDSDGQVIGFAGVNVDITQLKESEKERLALALEKERVHLLSSFIQDATHEFRTPLSIISLSTNLLSRTEDETLRSEKAQNISDQIARITKLVDSLAMITKLESYSASNHHPVDMHTLTRSVAHQIEQHYAGRNQIQFSEAERLPSVAGNEEFLAEAFRQILDNAYRFTPSNGAITVITSIVDDDIVIEVENTGEEIAEEDLVHVFETFWRLDKMHTSPGFGLGLAIARKVIEHHNGTIQIHSGDGQGTQVVITLPIASTE